MGSLGFFIDLILSAPGVDSASNSSEYKGYLLGVKEAGA